MVDASGSVALLLSGALISSLNAFEEEETKAVTAFTTPVSWLTLNLVKL